MTDKRKFANPMTLSNEIADIVRDRILRGEYRIGEKIKETIENIDEAATKYQADAVQAIENMH